MKIKLILISLVFLYSCASDDSTESEESSNESSTSTITIASSIDFSNIRVIATTSSSSNTSNNSFRKNSLSSDSKQLVTINTSGDITPVFSDEVFDVEFGKDTIVASGNFSQQFNTAATVTLSSFKSNATTTTCKIVKYISSDNGNARCILASDADLTPYLAVALKRNSRENLSTSSLDHENSYQLQELFDEADTQDLVFFGFVLNNKLSIYKNQSDDSTTLEKEISGVKEILYSKSAGDGYVFAGEKTDNSKFVIYYAEDYYSVDSTQAEIFEKPIKERLIEFDDMSFLTLGEFFIYRPLDSGNFKLNYVNPFRYVVASQTLSNTSVDEGTSLWNFKFPVLDEHKYILKNENSAFVIIPEIENHNLFHIILPPPMVDAGSTILNRHYFLEGTVTKVSGQAKFGAAFEDKVAIYIDSTDDRLVIFDQSPTHGVQFKNRCR